MDNEQMVPSGTAWVKNGFRVVYNLREIRRGREKGKYQIYYRRGKGFRKTTIDKYQELKNEN